MPTSLSRNEILSNFSIFLVCVLIIANTFQGDGNPIVASLAFSGVAFSSTYCLIRWLGDAFMRAGFKGKDMSKLKKHEM
jgi:UDP-N-acetylglucosamine--dolichyl-phosphate N-acetylglucosaminephosphotransferase